jgi:hypothetical protein
MVPILRISSQLYEPTDAARMRSFHQLVNSGHVDVHHSVLVALSVIYPYETSGSRDQNGSFHRRSNGFGEPPVWHVR